MGDSGRKRQTVAVAELVKSANRFLLTSKPEAEVERAAVLKFVTDVLKGVGRFEGTVKVRHHSDTLREILSIT